MLHYNIGGKDINIRLYNGIWVPYSESAMGKTYLMSLLRAYAVRNKDEIMSITLDSYKDDLWFVSEINRVKYELIFLDRADLYLTQECANCLIGLNSVVIIDIKNSSNIHGIGINFCEIYFDEKGFEVYD